MKAPEILLGDGWYGSPFFCRLDEDSEGLQSVKLLIHHLCPQLKEVRRTGRLGFFRRFSHDPGLPVNRERAVEFLCRFFRFPVRHEEQPPHIVDAPFIRGRRVEFGDTFQSPCGERLAVAILKSLPSPLHYTLVLTCAATALRSSEILALRWADVLWHEGRIRISKRWARGEDGETKTDASDGYVPLHPVLAGHLRAWREQTLHAKESDFVFPSMRTEGRTPLYSSVFVADYLRPAAKKAGVTIQDGQWSGLHNLRHSLSNWLVNKAKVEPKTVQGILRHSKIQTTLDLYTQEDSDETRAAQGEFLSAVGMSTTVN